MKRDLHKLFATAKARGWIVTRTGGDHFKLVHPPTGSVVFTGSTPSCRRGLLNFEADLRRAERQLSAEPMSTTTPIDLDAFRVMTEHELDGSVAFWERVVTLRRLHADLKTYVDGLPEYDRGRAFALLVRADVADELTVIEAELPP